MNIGGMQVTPLPMKQPSRMLDPPGTMRTPLGKSKLLHRISGLVEKGLPRGVHGHIHDRAHAKTQQDAFLHPAVHAPADRRRASGSAARTVPSFSASLKL